MALDLPKAMALGPPILSIIFRDIYCPRATKITMGSTQVRRKERSGSVCSMISPLKAAPDSSSIWVRLGSGIMPVE